MDYSAAWDRTIDAISMVCGHNPSIDIAIEYKPNEPRAYALIPGYRDNSAGLQEVGMANLGVTLDFAHVLL